MVATDCAKVCGGLRSAARISDLMFEQPRPRNSGMRDDERGRPQGSPLQNRHGVGAHLVDALLKPTPLFLLSLPSHQTPRFNFQTATRSVTDTRKRPAAPGARAFARTSRPRETEGAGNAAMPRGTRGLACKKNGRRTRVTARHRIIRHSPHNGFTVYDALSPAR
jgi:hypothetical protein